MFGSMSSGAIVTAVIAVIVAAGATWGVVRYYRRGQ